MAPAAGMLLARRLERSGLGLSRGLLLGAFLPALALALLPARADYRLANSARSAARQVMERHGPEPGQVWFLGHWGFQYYMEQLGGRPVDVRDLELAPGDLVVLPTNNTNLFELPEQALGETTSLTLETSGWGGTMHPHHSGFHSDVWGPLPYSFGRVPAETYWLRRVITGVHTRAR
jgi:hypothetical protein